MSSRAREKGLLLCSVLNSSGATLVTVRRPCRENDFSVESCGCSIFMSLNTVICCGTVKVKLLSVADCGSPASYKEI